jgi:hypothetical protein
LFVPARGANAIPVGAEGEISGIFSCAVNCLDEASTIQENKEKLTLIDLLVEL